jgi:hypothetical protein
MMEMLRGNPIPERGDARRKEGPHKTGRKHISMENKFR